MARLVVSDPVRVAGELDRLGTPAEILQQGARQGLGVGASYRARKYPANMAGFVAWGETLGDIRSRFIELQDGWEASSENSYETVVNRKRNLAIAVAAGDQVTGIDSGVDPVTKSNKGPFMARATAANQLSLLMEGVPAPQGVTGLQTWLLLFAYAPDDHEIRLELSLPLRIRPQTRVKSWDERIIIPSVPFDLPPLDIAVGGGDDGRGPDIEVRRRA